MLVVLPLVLGISPREFLPLIHLGKFHFDQPAEGLPLNGGEE